MVWRLWPTAKILTGNTSYDITTDHEKAIRNGVNLLPGSNINLYIAEDGYKKIDSPLLNPEQDVSNTEINESYEPGRE